MSRYIVPDSVNLGMKKAPPPVVVPPQVIVPKQATPVPKQATLVPKQATPPLGTSIPLLIPATPTRAPRIAIKDGVVKLENGDKQTLLDGRALFTFHHLRGEMLEFVKAVAGFRFLETKDLLRSGAEEETRVLADLAKYGVNPRNPEKEFANITESTMREIAVIRQIMDEEKLNTEDALAAYAFVTKRVAEKTEAIVAWLQLMNRTQAQQLAPMLNSAMNKALGEVATIRHTPASEMLLWYLITGERKHLFAELVAKVLEQISVSRQGAYNVTNAQVARVQNEYQALLFELRR